MEPNGNLKFLPETPTAQQAKAAYQHFEKLLRYIPANKWRYWMEYSLEIMAGSQDWADLPEDERSEHITGVFQLIHAFEKMEKMA